MCGRYVLADPDYIHKRFQTENSLKLSPLFNISPGEKLPVITHHSPNQMEIMKWGLIPSWAKDPKIGYRMINARSEGIEKKPSFRKPLKLQRCLIPANGFYEWQKSSGTKVPYYFSLRTKDMFAFAGLYDIWKSESGEEVKSYTIITTMANSTVKPIHDRMPVILSPQDEKVWLEQETDQVKILGLLQPYPAEDLEGYEVSTLVNQASNQSAELIKPQEIS
jgi:putative SOS response-associated peptidase YedK